LANVVFFQSRNIYIGGSLLIISMYIISLYILFCIFILLAAFFICLAHGVFLYVLLTAFFRFAPKLAHGVFSLRSKTCSRSVI
jgi:hypothetical protein